MNAVAYSDEPSAVFARLVRQLAPYAGDVVFVGGWVHAIYLVDAHAPERPVGTTDIDVTIPLQLPTHGRPPLVELAMAAGFCLDPLSNQADTPMMLYHPGPRGTMIDLDLLTEASDPLELIAIEGQPTLSVQGYPGQRILLENAEWKALGPEFHERLDPPVRVRVPTLAAYVLQKGLTAMQRSDPQRRAKDVIYLYEIVRHSRLGTLVHDGLPELATRYPSEYALWRRNLELVVASAAIRRDAADQLLSAGRSTEPLDTVAAGIAARLRRLLAEAPPGAA